MDSLLALSVFLNQKAKTTGILVHPIESSIDLLQVYSLLSKKKLDSLLLVLSSRERLNVIGWAEALLIGFYPNEHVVGLLTRELNVICTIYVLYYVIL